MIRIDRLSFKVCTEIIDQVFHDRYMAIQLHFDRLFGIIHPEYMLAIVCRSIIFWRHYYDLFEDLRLLCDTIQAEIPHLLALIAEAAHVVVIAIPDQCVRTDRIRIAVVCDIALLCDIEIGVVERDLPLGIDRLVDCIDDVISMFILRPHAPCSIDMPTELYGIPGIGQSKQIGKRQTTRLAGSAHL